MPFCRLAIGTACAASVAFANAAAPPVRLNTIGYLPTASKLASIAAPCTNFTVVRVADNKALFKGTVSGPVLNEDTSEELFTADFSSLEAPGEYELDVPGVGRSATFVINSEVYRKPFYLVTRGMYLWRCGTAVSATYEGKTFAHAACHTNDAWLDVVSGEHAHKDGTGGWHDAGDYNKYVVNAGVTVGVMLRAWEDFDPKLRSIRLRLDIPESGGKLPDYLAEIKWELDWMLKMQAPDGSVYHKLSTRNFGAFTPPEEETTERLFTPWGSEATADFVGTLAQAARHYRAYDAEYADRCLEAARKSYEFLQTHPQYHRADQRGFTTGGYETSPSAQNRLWAAAEIWETTGSAEALRDVESRIRAVGGKVSRSFDWPETKDLGLLTYLFSERTGRDSELVKLVGENLRATADEIVQTRDQHGYARPLGRQYFWGCNGAVARQTLILMAADRLVNGKATNSRGAVPSQYRAASLDALNYLLGRNSYGRSFVTGLGFQPPLHPHDRRCGDGTDMPWPGYLVGGGNPRAADWHDVQSDYRTNEIAINWNAALIYALAAALPD